MFMIIATIRDGKSKLTEINAVRSILYAAYAVIDMLTVLSLVYLYHLLGVKQRIL